MFHVTNGMSCFGEIDSRHKLYYLCQSKVCSNVLFDCPIIRTG